MFGLSAETVRKAERLVKHNRVQVTDSTNRFYVFKVYGTQRQYECFLRFDRRGLSHYSCNSDNDGWSCVFSNKDRHQPYCAHTLAAYLLLRREKIIDYEETLFLDWQDQASRQGIDSEAANELLLQATINGRVQMIQRAGACKQPVNTAKHSYTTRI